MLPIFHVSKEEYRTLAQQCGGELHRLWLKFQRKATGQKLLFGREKDLGSFAQTKLSIHRIIGRRDFIKTVIACVRNRFFKNDLADIALNLAHIIRL